MLKKDSHKKLSNFKILLVYPNIQMCEMMPYSIGLLTGILRREGFSVDLFDPKFGKNEEIVVVAFVADSKEPADDLKSFIENGAFDQLDCEVSGGPNKKGHYLVFCEFNRNDVLFREVAEVVTHIYQVAGITPDEWKFRAYRNEEILPFNEENFVANIITDPATYKTMEELADPGTDEEQSAETTLSTEALEYKKRYQFLANY